MVLELEGVSVKYGSVVAVRELSLIARNGEVTGVVGPNGSGKSSLFSAIYGSVRSTGAMRLDGEDIDRRSALQRAQRGFAYVPQGRQLFMKMSVIENLMVGAELVGKGKPEVGAALDRFPVLRERAKSYAGVLSGGEQQMLVLARALLVQPRVLLLDEMTTGLAPRIVAELRSTVVGLAEEGVAVLVAEPALNSLKSIVDRGIVMQRGEVRNNCESPEELDRANRDSMGLTESIIGAAVDD